MNLNFYLKLFLLLFSLAANAKYLLVEQDCIMLSDHNVSGNIQAKPGIKTTTECNTFFEKRNNCEIYDESKIKDAIILTRALKGETEMQEYFSKEFNKTYYVNKIKSEFESVENYERSPGKRILKLCKGKIENAK